MTTSWHYRKCPSCGAMVLSKAQDAYNSPCPKCSRAKRSYSKNARFNYSDADSLFIENDPLDFYEGGFKKGTPITQVQVVAMCSMGSFTEGTTLYDRHNTHYKAVTYRGKQRLIII